MPRTLFTKSPSEKPLIVPVFIPHAGCPHQCAFCNQQAITQISRGLPSPEEVISRIQTFLGYSTKKDRTVQISFYGGNFLGLKQEDILQFLRIGQQFVHSGKVHSLRFSTRPDTISTQTLDLIKDFPVSTVEIGAQSMNDEVLELSHRGHSCADTENAVSLLKERCYECGLQMMIGLPGETEENLMRTGRKIVELSPDFVRIYPTLVLENSVLARQYREGRYTPISLDAAVTLAKKLYLLFTERNIRVIRMGLQASGDLSEDSAILAGPWHPAFGFLVHSEIYLDRAAELLRKFSGSTERIVLGVHPRHIPEMRGMKNRNMEILKKMFAIDCLQIIPDENAEEGEILILP
ncbi:MAG: elongator complex protein 3 [Desulfococcaceae bacterium]